MRLARSTASFRRRAALVFFGALLTTVALGLSQCRMVNESLTGVSLDRQSPDKCIAKCSKSLEQRIEVAGKVHVAHLRDCYGDPVCIALENAHYEEQLQQIYADYRDCLNNCHHQGSGGGGR
jgi:hypothetical protein